MNLEIEAKMRLSNAVLIETRLGELAGKPIEISMQSDLFFDRLDRPLRAEDRGLRIRRVRRPDSTSWDQVVMTYKGPRQPGPLKQREEIEFSVGDDQLAREFLVRLGFQPLNTIEKRRKSWRLGDCRVELDEVVGLGSFIEIEGPDEASVMNARQQLGLDQEPLIREGYAQLLHDSDTK